MGKFKNNEKGFIAAEAVLGIGVFILLSTLAIILVLNIYNVNLSTHRLATAVDYAVEILENAKLLNYYDSKLAAGEYSGNSLLGVQLGENYIANLVIKDYNKFEGNESKENLIKILKIYIEYTDGELTKSIEISTLKLNNNV